MNKKIGETFYSKGEPFEEEAISSNTSTKVFDIVSNKATKLFIILGGFFVTNALVAEFIGVKIFALEDTLGVPPFNFNLFGQQGALMFSAGVLLWPIVFIMTDIINEYYGKRGIKLLSFMTVGLITYAFVMIYAAISLAPADWWVAQNANRGVPNMQAAFNSIFGQGLLIIIGSIIAFLVGQFIDVIVFHNIKKLTGEKKIWLRATGSTVISQLIDSFIVLYIAFKIGPELGLVDGLNPWSWSQLLAVATVNYTYKFFMAVILTPLLYIAHNFIDNYLGKEVAEQMKEKATTWN